MSKLTENFWEKVAISDGCWLWRGGKMKNGYANFFVGRKSFRIHRLSYEAFNGPIPNGMGVCHSCDVRHCVNPKHLFPGTQKDNLQDCKSKGRTTFGSRNAQAKLSECGAAEIHRLTTTKTATQRAIAESFGVSQSQVSRIASNKAWTHI